MATTATLELGILKCNRKQDVTGFDEPRIKVNGRVEWNGSMKKDDTEDLNRSISFIDFATLTLEEMNGNKPKQIGAAVEVRADRAGAGMATFKTSGAPAHGTSRTTPSLRADALRRSVPVCSGGPSWARAEIEFFTSIAQQFQLGLVTALTAQLTESVIQNQACRKHRRRSDA